MSTQPNDSPATRLPAWQQAPFDRFVEYAKQVHRLLHLAIHGIRILSTHDKLVESLQEYDKVVSSDEPKSPNQQAAELEAARAEAAFARAEVENDFPKLRAHSLLDLWASLEVLVEDVLVAWLMHTPELLSSDELSRIRIPFGEFQRLDEEERLRFLVQELKRDRKADLKGGVTRFEVMLAVIGLDGEVENSLRQAVWEVHQVRNSIVHRTGLADRRLLSACPWMSLKIGEPVPLSESQRYDFAVISYAFVIFNRARSQGGLPPIAFPAYETESDPGQREGRATVDAENPP
jgi:hypothetical protein